MSQKHMSQNEAASTSAVSPLRRILALIVLLSSAAVFALLLAKSNDTSARVIDAKSETKPTVVQSMPPDPSGFAAAFGPTMANDIAPTGTAPQGMAWIPGASFRWAAMWMRNHFAVCRVSLAMPRRYIEFMWIRSGWILRK